MEGNFEACGPGLSAAVVLLAHNRTSVTCDIMLGCAMQQETHTHTHKRLTAEWVSTAAALAAAAAAAEERHACARLSAVAS